MKFEAWSSKLQESMGSRDIYMLAIDLLPVEKGLIIIDKVNIDGKLTPNLSEIVLVENVSQGLLKLTRRGLGGTIPKVHLIGASIELLNSTSLSRDQEENRLKAHLQRYLRPIYEKP